MRIWYLNPYAGGPNLGPAYRPYYLSRAWIRAGHEPIVVTSGFHHLLDEGAAVSQDLDILGVRYLALPTRRYRGNGLGRVLNMLDFARQVGGLSKRVGRDLDTPDALIVSSPHPFAFIPAYFLAQRLKCALVFEVRDLWPLSLQEILGTPAMHPFVMACRWIERFAYQHSDLVASLLPGVDRHIVETLGRERPFVWVPNGVDIDAVSDLKLRSETGRAIASQIDTWQKDGRIVGVFAGTIGPTTGVSLLVQAASLAALAPGGDRLAIIIFGKGTWQERVAQEARAVGSDIVRIYPSVSKEEAVALICKADFGYAGGMPHDKLYGYGTSQNKTMDYMQCGLPVIFPMTAYRDPVRESGGGLALDETSAAKVAEALLSFARMSSSERLRMGRAGAAYVRAHFDWNLIAANYVTALEATR